MIIPDEYATLGLLPPHWIVDSLMRYLGQKYYIGLLSAAAFYGATDQQPMVFQVITDKVTRKIFLPRGGIEFHFTKEIPQAQISTLTVPTGYATISTKEQTMVDLVKYHKVSGYLSNVADVINQLSKECSSESLSAVTVYSKTPVLQRLGHILEIYKHNNLAKVVAQKLLKRKTQYVLLRPDFPKKTGPKIKQWKLINNDPLEVT